MSLFGCSWGKATSGLLLACQLYSCHHPLHIVNTPESSEIKVQLTIMQLPHMAQVQPLNSPVELVAEAAVQLVMARLNLVAHGGQLQKAGVNAIDLGRCPQGLIGPLAEWPSTESWSPRGTEPRTVWN